MANVQKRGNTFRIRVSCGYDVNGKQIFKSHTYVPEQGMTEKQIEKELQRQIIYFEDKCKKGLVLDGSIKFGEFAEKWFADYAEKQLKAKTVARYKDLMKRINPAIGHIKLESLQPHHLMSFYSNLEEAGLRGDVKYKACEDFKSFIKEKGFTKEQLSKNADVSQAVLTSCFTRKNISKDSAEEIAKALGLKLNNIFTPVGSEKPLSDKTRLHYHRLISSICETAVKWQVIVANPCNRVSPPKVEKTEVKCLDEVQAMKVLQLVEEEHIIYKAAVYTLLYTGCRRGELCGLEWSDIDFKNSVIHIQRSSLYLPQKGIYDDTTKTYSSDRVLKVPEVLLNVLKALKSWQTEESFKLSNKWVRFEKVFTSLNGSPIHPDVLSAWFKKFVSYNNLPDISLHSLRHTNATLLIASGTDIKTVSKRLGHADVVTTGKIYTHALKSADEIASDVLGDILSPNKKRAKEIAQL